MFRHNVDEDRQLTELLKKVRLWREAVAYLVPLFRFPVFSGIKTSSERRNTGNRNLDLQLEIQCWRDYL